MNLLGNRVLVLREPMQEKTDSGIYLPEQSQKKRQKGKVIKVGSTANKTLEAKTVIFDPNCGTPFNYENVEHLIMFESDIRLITK